MIRILLGMKFRIALTAKLLKAVTAITARLMTKEVSILLVTAKAEQIEEIERKFPELKTTIPGIISIEWGTNNSPEGLNKGFTHCFVVTFENDQARCAYLPHSNHQVFVNILKPLLDDVFVIDFNL